jgi:hypothetical protein
MKYVVFDPADGKTVRDANEDEIDLFVDKQGTAYLDAVEEGDYRLAAWLADSVQVVGSNLKVGIEVDVLFK